MSSQITRRSMGSDGKRIKSLDTTYQIIQTMEAGEFVSVTDIADKVGVTKGTVHNHLSTLVANELAIKKNGKYRLSLRFFDIGTSICDSYQQDVMIETLESLGAETEGRAHFVIQQHDYAYCIHKSGTVSGMTNVETRIRTALTETAPGLAILSVYSDEQLATGFDLSNDDREAIMTIRDDGYAVGETLLETDGLRSIARHVRITDKIMGAVSLALKPEPIEYDVLETEYPNRVRKAANAIEVNLTLSQ